MEVDRIPWAQMPYKWFNNKYRNKLPEKLNNYKQYWILCLSWKLICLPSMKPLLLLLDTQGALFEISYYGNRLNFGRIYDV